MRPRAHGVMLIMVDAASGFVLGFETIPTKEGFDAAMVRIPDAITAVLKKANVVPTQIAPGIRSCSRRWNRIAVPTG